MDALTCGICLEQLKIPVSTPCGHLCCEACLTAYIEASADAMNASCPTCRAPFTIAIPDLRFVPKKYHTLILPSIRRVFISPNASASIESQHELRAQVARLTEKIDALVEDKATLMDRCEAAIRASQIHAQGERDERLEKERLQRELRDLRKKYENVKGKYKTLKTYHDSASASASATHMKRTSSQAALDNSSYSASSSTDSLVLPAVPEQDDAAGASGISASRPILRIPKRPRLLGSPFDLSKRIETRQMTRARRTFDSDEDEDEDHSEHARGGGRSGIRSSDLSSSAGSNSGLQRPGLPVVDMFSPRDRAPEGRALFTRGGRTRSGSVFSGGWMLSPEDA